MTLADKQRELSAQLSRFKNGQDRLAALVARARVQKAFPAEWRTDGNLIPGCLAKLWFVPEFREGKCYFTADSDSLIVKAIAGLLCEFYSGQPAAEILAHDPGFLAPLGITQHLTPNRRNALSKIWERIHDFVTQHALPNEVV
jgi:cysteine desulfuration protein SufE